MTIHLLWPTIRWPDELQIEREAVGPGVTPHFSHSVKDVTDAVWALADGIVGGPDLPDEIIAKMKRCRIHVRPAVGFDNIDIARWGRHGIPVCNTPDYGTMEVADHAMALMLSLMKSIAFHDERLREDPRGNWMPALNPFGKRLSICTFGIVGLGRIGTATALRAKAFGMNVVFYDPYKPNGSDLALGIKRADSLAELFAQSDVVSLHAPSSEETRGLIGRDVFAAAKKGIILVNTARGAIVDIDALHDAMKDGIVLAAGLDVLPTEPADVQAPLIKAWHAEEEWIRHRLLLTPHSAFFTPESARDMRAIAARTAAKYLRDGRLENCVNEQFLTHRR
jgi:lactate dehydrogenase-like 2-hydroxyacid dehydrogenase